jgi:hypothetical protein
MYDKDNIATSVKIGCREIENVVYKFLIFDLVFLIWTNRDRLCLTNVRNPTIFLEFIQFKLLCLVSSCNFDVENNSLCVYVRYEYAE